VERLRTEGDELLEKDVTMTNALATMDTNNNRDRSTLQGQLTKLREQLSKAETNASTKDSLIVGKNEELSDQITKLQDKLSNA